MKKLSTKVLLSALGVVLAGGAFSQVQAADTLAKIKASGKVVIGYRESSDPISYIVGGKPLGYAVDICNTVAAELKKELKLPNLKVEYKPVTSSTRIPEMLAGNIDMECGTTTNSIQRQQQVSFSTNYYATEVRMAVKANSTVKDLGDLNGKAVATTQGTTSDKYIKMGAKGEQVKVTNVYGKDHSDSFAMVASGRAAAFVMDDNILAGLIAKSSNPKDFKIVGPVLSSEPYGIMLPKGDVAFKKVADRVVNSMWKNGQMAALYKKWFLSPIPPKNINLNMPMSSSYNKLKAAPNDKGIN
ncbi:amino acid ABC transporter substrate-binding protein [Acinetobacter sp. 187]|uniref:Amino acid ABC transporter substrate-binding protein n=1 Tax=Acinetobacter lanii TaxID=2715163 RepID=A0A6G8S8I7_9GAMM|nr:amino acid ABC transporter substrate-binding protein [Acinetobacter lanii]NHC04682.1 amino acid ABC transporter substrate-binding protein [Acinetobacter lanii]QIO10444.1 amino acid ABC transporter substrate-binding protein [Acinetobacter lanii]